MSADHKLRIQYPPDTAAKTLVVGDIAKWAAQGRLMPDLVDLTYVAYDVLDHDTVAQLRPKVVLSPLMADRFDAYQVIMALAAYRFQGSYRAVAVHQPHCAMIKAELRAAAPDIDFDIVVMPPKGVAIFPTHPAL